MSCRFAFYSLIITSGLLRLQRCFHFVSNSQSICFGHIYAGTFKSRLQRSCASDPTTNTAFGRLYFIFYCILQRCTSLQICQNSLKCQISNLYGGVADTWSQLSNPRSFSSHPSARHWPVNLCQAHSRSIGVRAAGLEACASRLPSAHKPRI